MPETFLPFDVDKKAKAHSEDRNPCSLYLGMSKPLQDAVNEHVHLNEYLHVMPTKEEGVPRYYPELSRKLSSLKRFNLIYPVGGDVFSHIYENKDGGGRVYVSVEPATSEELASLTADLEEKLVLLVTDSVKEIESEEDKTEVLLSSLDKIYTTGAVTKYTGAFLDRVFKPKVDRIRVTKRELEKIKYVLLRDKVGMGILEPLILDPYIEDISCSGVGRIYLEHKIFKSIKTAVSFAGIEELDTFVLRLAERIKKPATFANPIVDAVLPDGSRINIVYGTHVSKRGSNFTIRKFAETPFSVLELVEFGTLDFQMAAYLSMMIEEGMNLFVAGETASGKTTLLNALTTFISPDAKIVTVEDTPEVQVPHGNWVREVVSRSKEHGAGVGMFDLLKAALRQRPNQIIIGEIRGEEGLIAFQAMQTGHPVMATFHASSVEKLIQRLTGSPISVPKTYIDNLNVAVIQSAVKLPEGKDARRILSISELVGYDSASDSFSFVEVFRWDSSIDKFEFVGNMNSYLLENKVAIKRGIPSQNKRRIYADLDRRARILKKLSEQGVKGFYDLLEVMEAAQRQGLF